MVQSIEQNVEWIADCIGYMRENGFACVEADVEAEDEWVAHVNEVADATLYSKSLSWYIGSNIPGKARVFMPYIGFPDYVRKCDVVATKGSRGLPSSNGPTLRWWTAVRRGSQRKPTTGNRPDFVSPRQPRCGVHGASPDIS